MPTGRIVHLKGFKLDKKTGKPVKDKSKQPVSARIAEKRKPKTKFNHGGSNTMFKIIMIAAGAFVLAFGNAKAADLYKPELPAEVAEVVTPKATSYRSGCYVEGSVGVGITEASALGVTFSDQGAVYGLGGGCDLVTGSLLIGALGHVDFTNQSFSGTSVDPTYQLGIRAGVLLSPHVLAYAVGGWALTDIGNDFDGYYAGGGLEVLINDHLFIGGEYTANLYRAEQGVDVTGHAVRARVGWRF